MIFSFFFYSLNRRGRWDQGICNDDHWTPNVSISLVHLPPCSSSPASRPAFTPGPNSRTVDLDTGDARRMGEDELCGRGQKHSSHEGSDRYGHVKRRRQTQTDI